MIEEVGEPHAGSFEPEPEVELVLRWDGEHGEQRLTFRSAWLPWTAARRFRALMA